MSETTLTVEDARVAGKLGPGARVEVRTRFDGSWTSGFEIVGAVDGAWHIRRLSDGSVLPGTFPRDEVRPAH